ncbi:MAG TPA: hypothetical protein VHG51_05710 [Longimicrobiaceae bacterium]|nr:hypothetical protein [Longimicrobiaceae bacterium]
MSLSSRRTRLLTCVVGALALAPGASLGAQVRPTDPRNETFVGSELEDYLRLLQVTGDAGLYPWSVRSFSPGEVERLLAPESVHPWGGRFAVPSGPGSGLRAGLVRPRVGVEYNTAFPYGANDGAVWSGRGATVSLQAGFSAVLGPLSVTVAPVAFWAENREFDLQANGYEGRLAFADARWPDLVDSPQRFGDGTYARIDPGQSTVRADLGPVALGVSSANQQWGPARYNPVILGGNAPGFVHAFAGTSRPVDLWVGKVHGRLVWGRLEQSEYSGMPSDSSRRLMSGLVATFTPRGLPGLEVGLTRFFHAPWTADGVDRADLLLPLQGFLKVGLDDRDDNEDAEVRNQLASLFFRAVLPGSGFEVYGEYGRDDHNWDFRDFVLEPDHQSAYTLGLSKVWERSGTERVAVHGEVTNSQVTHLSRVRPEGSFYYHTGLRQGHTHRGQFLGSPAIYGGAGSTLAAEYYQPGGRWSISWDRALRQDDAPIMWGYGSSSQGVDSYHTLRAEVLRFVGRWELAGELAGVYNRRRYFDSNVFNLNAGLSVSSSF